VRKIVGEVKFKLHEDAIFRVDTVAILSPNRCKYKEREEASDDTLHVGEAFDVLRTVTQGSDLTRSEPMCIG